MPRNFTPETARIASAKGREAKKAKSLVRNRLDAIETRLAVLEANEKRRRAMRSHHAQPQPPARPSLPPVNGAASRDNPGAFALIRAEQIKQQLARLSAQMAAATDLAEVERLVKLSRPLHEQWLDLTGRPKAGRRRPGRVDEERLEPVSTAPLGRADEEADEEPPVEGPDDVPEVPLP